MRMADEPDTFSPNDLTKADLKELDKLNEALKTGGVEALDKAQAELRERDLIAWFNIVRAFFPALANKLREKRTNRGRVLPKEDE
jgi:hypothetical protein